MPFEVEVLPDAAAVARRGAEVVAEAAAAAIDDHGRFTFAVSGGHTPWAMFAELPGALAWDRVTIFQVDERVAPDGDPDRNLTHLLESLPAGAGADVRAMPVGAGDLDAAAAEYAASFADPFDLVLDVADRDVAVTGVYQGRRRMTLTYPVLNRARRILWLVTGEDKDDALRRLRDGDHSIPGGRVSREQALVVADAAAAGTGS